MLKSVLLTKLSGQCMDGMHVDQLTTIWEWITDTWQSNIFLIYRSPGAGKSAIALTLAFEIFQKYHCTVLDFSSIVMQPIACTWPLCGLLSPLSWQVAIATWRMRSMISWGQRWLVLTMPMLSSSLMPSLKNLWWMLTNVTLWPHSYSSLMHSTSIHRILNSGWIFYKHWGAGLNYLVHSSWSSLVDMTPSYIKCSMMFQADATPLRSWYGYDNVPWLQALKIQKLVDYAAGLSMLAKLMLK